MFKSAFSPLLIILALITIVSVCEDSYAGKKKPLAADLVEDGQLINLETERYKKLFEELQVKHKFSRQELEKIFRGVTIRKRVLELMDKQWESRPWYEYYPRFITTRNIREGQKKLKQYGSSYQGLLKRIS